MLTVTTEQFGKRAHFVSVVGEIDSDASPRLGGVLDRLLEAGSRRLVIDLSGTTFIDSTTLGVLVRAGRRLRRSGGGMGLVCGNHDIRRVLEMTLLDRIFSIHETRAEALASVGPAAPLLLR